MWILRNDLKEAPVNISTANALEINNKHEVCAVWNIGTTAEYWVPITIPLKSRAEAETHRRNIAQQLQIVQLA